MPTAESLFGLSKLASAVQWILRLLIGIIVLGSSVGKLLDLSGFVEVLRTYQVFPDVALWPVALFITTVEFLLGTWVLSGWHLRMSAMVTALLNGIYAVWMTVTLLRGLELDNCGCFGVFFPRPLTWQSPFEDLAMAGLCYGLSRLASESATSVQL